MKVDDFLQKVLDGAHTKLLKQKWEKILEKNDERNGFSGAQILK